MASVAARSVGVLEFRQEWRRPDRFEGSRRELVAYGLIGSAAAAGLIGLPWWSFLVTAVLISIIRTSTLRGRIREVAEERQMLGRRGSLLSAVLVGAAFFLSHVLFCACAQLIGLALGWALRTVF